MDAFPFWVVGFALALGAPWSVGLLVAAVERRVRRRTAEVLGPPRAANRHAVDGDAPEP